MRKLQNFHNIFLLFVQIYYFLYILHFIIAGLINLLPKKTSISTFTTYKQVIDPNCVAIKLNYSSLFLRSYNKTSDCLFTTIMFANFVS